MAPFIRLTQPALDMIAYDIGDKVFGCGDYPMLDNVDPDQLRAALPAFLRALGVDIPGGGPEPAADFVRHTCRNGRGPAFGRLAPRGQCARCDQLHDGAAPREAHPAIKASNRRRADEVDYDARRREHFAPGGPHARGACGPVCTSFDY